MYAITVDRTFSAAHAIRLPDGSMEPVHGHDWRVRVRIESPELDAIETVMDFHVLEARLDEVIGGANNNDLNAIPPFAGGAVNPTAERVAWWIAETLRDVAPKPARLTSVRVTEAPGCEAEYRPEPRTSPSTPAQASASASVGKGEGGSRD